MFMSSPSINLFNLPVHLFVQSIPIYSPTHEKYTNSALLFCEWLKTDIINNGKEYPNPSILDNCANTLIYAGDHWFYPMGKLHENNKWYWYINFAIPVPVQHFWTYNVPYRYHRWHIQIQCTVDSHQTSLGCRFLMYVTRPSPAMHSAIHQGNGRAHNVICEFDFIL